MRGVALKAAGIAAYALLPMTVIAVEPARPVAYADQGSSWALHRDQFYLTDQGSQLIPLAWARALRTPNGEAFLADGLARYGYLPNPRSPDGLPIGFTASGRTTTGTAVLGMTCAACHTRQIQADDGQQWRIDGAPALVDFQSLLADIDAAVGRALASDAAFAEFAAATGTPAAQVPALRASVDLWYQREHTLISKALPSQSPWGLGRADAIGMIFNRVAGLDIGQPPTFLIKANIQPAEAPVRYPFLWNAPFQDKTQWPGFVPNGNDLFGFLRNLGQVYGVFATFRPHKELFNLGINLRTPNSANFAGLAQMEAMVKTMEPPKWPWAVEPNHDLLTAHGAELFTARCASCHGENPPSQPGGRRLWRTWVGVVQTDTRQYDILARTVDTRLLAGARTTPFTAPLPPAMRARDLLSTLVGGTLYQNLSIIPLLGRTPSGEMPSFQERNEQVRRTVQMFVQQANEPPRGSYEARVLHGIWATAPYLHNGSVATLADLLKPAAARSPSFAVGPYYDIKAIGLAADQHGSRYILNTTGCDDLNSGNSRCGHEYGTDLLEADKKALLEYLKTL